jgi:hypothetical protein
MSWTISLLSLAVALQAPFAAKSSDKPLEIRVGIVAFEDFREESDRSEQLLAELAKAHDTPMQFKLAVGTYGDVAHWLKTGLTDIAVVTPGLFVELADGGSGETRAPRYLVTVGRPAATSTWPVKRGAGRAFTTVTARSVPSPPTHRSNRLPT